MALTEKTRAHLLRVLQHQEKLAASPAPPERPSKEPQLKIPLIGEVRRTTEADASKAKPRRSRKPVQPKLKGI